MQLLIAFLNLHQFKVDEIGRASKSGHCSLCLETRKRREQNLSNLDYFNLGIQATYTYIGSF